MLKRLTTLEMLGEIKAGDKYVNEENDIVKYNENGYLVWEDCKSPVTVSLMLFSGNTWKKVQQSVDFITAINSKLEIKFETWINYESITNVYKRLYEESPIIAEQWVNGRWYIKKRGE